MRGGDISCQGIYVVLLSINNGSVVDNVVQLATFTGSTPTLVGTNQALSLVNWPYNTPVTSTYGGAGNLLGVLATTMTPGMVNNANFGVAISATVVTAPLQVSIGMTAAIDQVSMTVYTTPPTTLPILLERFTVSGGSAGNLVSWTAGANSVANEFIVQRSSDGNNWQDLTTVTAVAGSTESYAYTDADAPTGANYYRLKLVNDDGSVGVFDHRGCGHQDPTQHPFLSESLPRYDQHLRTYAFSPRIADGYFRQDALGKGICKRDQQRPDTVGSIATGLVFRFGGRIDVKTR